MGAVLLRLHVGMAATLMPLLVGIFSIPTLLRLLSARRRWRPYRRFATQDIAETVRRRLRNPRVMRRRACMREGLMLFHFLSLAGIASEVHFVVYPATSPTARMRAHCWVTVDGVALSAPPQDPCAEVFVYRSTPSAER